MDIIHIHFASWEEISYSSRALWAMQTYILLGLEPTGIYIPPARLRGYVYIYIGGTATHLVRHEYTKKVPELEKHDATGHRIAEPEIHIEPGARYDKVSPLDSLFYFLTALIALSRVFLQAVKS